MVCFNCNEKGHRAFECVEADKVDDRVCYNCNQTGHVARVCIVILWYLIA